MTDDERWDGDADQYPEGPIEPGMMFVWEPYLPHAMCLVGVVETNRNTDDELWICTDQIMRHPEQSSIPFTARSWNDESRFRQAAALVLTLGQGPLGLAGGESTRGV